MIRRAGRAVRFWLPLVRLAPGRRARLRLCALTLELTLRHKLRRPPRTPRRLDLVANEVPVSFLVGGIGEVHGLREVFVQGDYDLPAAQEPAVILDLGGNIGASAVFFATRHPSARVIVLEPEPETFTRLEHNSRPFPNITPLPLAVTSEDAEVRLHCTGYTLTSSLLPPAARSETIPVEGVSLDSLLAREGLDRVDLLKFDVEGVEDAVLRHSTRLADVDAFVGEIHERVMGASAEEFEQLFEGCETSFEPLPNGEQLFRAWRRSRN